LLLGHRGARRYAPENSLAAFDLALAHGCDGFEFDVRRTRDRRGIICHDPQLQRRSISKTSYAKFQQMFAADAPACVDEVVARYGWRAFLDIELKVGGLEDQVIAAVRAAKIDRAYVVSSFRSSILRALRARDPNLRTGLITENPKRLGLWERLGVSALIPSFQLVTRQLVDELHAAERQVFVWTVNEEQDMRRMAELEVDAIISDDTALLSGVFGAGAAHGGA
jgi:glycerophosphoryl diester phosphodiesterase